MSYLITAIAFIVIFSVLVLIHEFGHFITAKRAGIKVEEFGFGLPPRIWGKKKGETIYSINWIPFGGFVRMLGEDALDKKAAKDRRSFAAQSAWVRIKVVCAGVVMNFLLAWLLLAIAFSVGTQPFLSSNPSGNSEFVLGPDKIMEAIDNGLIEVNIGAGIVDVLEGSLADELGFESGDRIIMLDGHYLNQEVFADFVSGNYVHDYKVLRGDEEVDISVNSLDSNEDLGLIFEDYGSFPWLLVSDLDPFSPFYSAGLAEKDLIVSFNGKSVHSIEDFEDQLKMRFYDFEVFDGDKIIDVSIENEDFKILVSDVFDGMPAAEAGFDIGDEIVSVNDEIFNSVQGLVDFIVQSDGAQLNFDVLRDGEMIGFLVESNEDNVIGVGLTVAMSYDVLNGLEIMSTNIISGSKLNELKYPPHVAVYKSLKETVTMSKFTAVMFVDFLRGLFVEGSVGQDVAGPIGIAQLTHGFVQEGLVALLVFMAVLSLSLAVINILPIPALDGGRLLFILIEVFTGKKLDHKKEAYVHMLGYVLILLLILVVTYGDILRIASKS